MKAVERICAACGRGNGWHAWTCLELEYAFRLQEKAGPLMILTHDEDPGGVRVIDTAVLESLPEVE